MWAFINFRQRSPRHSICTIRYNTSWKVNTQYVLVMKWPGHTMSPSQNISCHNTFHPSGHFDAERCFSVLHGMTQSHNVPVTKHLMSQYVPTKWANRCRAVLQCPSGNGPVTQLPRHKTSHVTVRSTQVGISRRNSASVSSLCSYICAGIFVMWDVSWHGTFRDVRCFMAWDVPVLLGGCYILDMGHIVIFAKRMLQDGAVLPMGHFVSTAYPLSGQSQLVSLSL